MVQAWPMLEIQLFSYKNCDFFLKNLNLELFQILGYLKNPETQNPLLLPTPVCIVCVSKVPSFSLHCHNN